MVCVELVVLFLLMLSWFVWIGSCFVRRSLACDFVLLTGFVGLLGAITPCWVFCCCYGLLIVLCAGLIALRNFLFYLWLSCCCLCFVVYILFGIFARGGWFCVDCCLRLRFSCLSLLLLLFGIMRTWVCLLGMHCFVGLFWLPACCVCVLAV